jgi:hypothetical protein
VIDEKPVDDTVAMEDRRPRRRSLKPAAEGKKRGSTGRNRVNVPIATKPDGRPRQGPGKPESLVKELLENVSGRHRGRVEMKKTKRPPPHPHTNRLKPTFVIKLVNGSVRKLGHGSQKLLALLTLGGPKPASDTL